MGCSVKQQHIGTGLGLMHLKESLFILFIGYGMSFAAHMMEKYSADLFSDNYILVFGFKM